ncbi:MAG: glycosyltransferase family 2 protein [Phocaeicola sp.]
MQKNKRVSIIIPVYNVEPYIERCIKSVLSQNFPNIEMVLVDDCSPDNSMKIAQKVIEESNFGGTVKLVSHKINGGLSAARNTGINASSGDYLYFLDSDDAISDDCITLLVESIGNCDFAIGNYKALNTKKEYPTLKLQDRVEIRGESVLNSYLNGEWYMMAVNKLVSKKFLIENKLFFEEGLIHEDELWSFMLAATAKSFITVNNFTYLYYIREGSITSGSIQRKVNAMVEIFERMVEFSYSQSLISNQKVLSYLDFFASLTIWISLQITKDRRIYYLRIRNVQLKYSSNFYSTSIIRKVINWHLKLPEKLAFYYVNITSTLYFLYIKLRHQKK